MAKSALRFVVGVLSFIFSKIEEGKAAAEDFSMLISKFEEKLYPLLEMVYQLDHQRAKKCFEKGETFETIEEYLMIILCMLVVKGFNDLSKGVPELSRLEFDLNVDDEDSQNLEKCLEVYPYDLKQALDEHVRIRDPLQPSVYSEEGEKSEEAKGEDEFPDFDEGVEESNEDFGSSPRFNNLYYQQNTQDYVSKDTFRRGESKMDYGQSKMKQSSEEKPGDFLEKVEKVLKSDSGKEQKSRGKGNSK